MFWFVVNFVMRKAFILLLVFASMAGAAYPPVIEGARVETYEKVDGAELKLWVVGEKVEGKAKPAAVLFLGAGGGLGRRIVCSGTRGIWRGRE